jgi:hypothetical protein
LKTTHLTTKLAPKQYGPFTIKKKVSDVVFQLELPHQWKIHNVFHASLLTPYVEMDLHGPNFPEPPPEIIEGDLKFEVEQIVGLRRIGKKKTLQYKICWKGYSPAYGSWEPATQVHTPNLIEEFRKIRSSQKNNATINYQLASGIPSRPKALTRPRAYSSPTEAESSKPEGETDKGSVFGKRTQGLPIIWMGNKERSSFSNSDKKGGQRQKKIISPPSPFHINSCTMSTNKEICDTNNEPPPLSLEEQNQIMDKLDVDIFAPGSDNALTLLLEGVCYDKYYEQKDKEKEEPLAGPSNQPWPQTTVEDVESEKEIRSKQTSLALTDDLHPGYPYRENVNNNDDLPQDGYPRPYLAAQVNCSNGDPRVHGKAERGAPIYDEGPLVTQPWAVVKDDIENEIATYPLEENTYLNTDFLQAVRDLND